MSDLDRTYRFGIVGTSCAGKTTKAYDVLAKLKKDGYTADGILQQDRRLAFDKERLDDDEDAQYWVLFNQMLKELEVTIGRPNKIVVSDRTPLDFYAYYEQLYGPDTATYSYLCKWMRDKYDVLFYLEPLELEQDGARPNNRFRMEVDELIQKYLDDVPCKVVRDRKLIYKRIENYVKRQQ